MTVFARHKTTKENIEVFSTDESISTASSGILIGLNSNLRIVVVNNTSTYNIAASGSRKVQIPLSDDQIESLLQYNSSTSKYEWLTNYPLVVPIVHIPESSASQNVVANVIADEESKPDDTIGPKISNGYINLNLQNLDTNNNANGINVQALIIMTEG